MGLELTNSQIFCGLCVALVLCFQYFSVSEHEVSSRKENYSSDQTLQLTPKFLSSRFASRNRLGNHMFEMASIIGIARKLNRIPLFFIHDESYRSMLEYTQQVLPGITDQYLVINGTISSGYRKVHFPTNCCSFDNLTRLENINDTFLDLSGEYYQSWRYFPELRTNIASFLTVKNNFTGLPISKNTNVITCIHIRRTDFIGINRFMADKKFILKAVEYIDEKQKEKFSNREKIVVLFGDDHEFMKSIFSNSTDHFISKNSPVDDLLYASKHCDNVLLTAPVSTFGWWIGYLSRSVENVFYVDVRYVDDGLYKTGVLNPDDFFLPQWTALKFDNKTNSIMKTRSEF